MYSQRFSIAVFAVISLSLSACSTRHQTDLSFVPYVHVPEQSQLDISEDYVERRADRIGSKLAEDSAEYQRVERILARLTDGLGVPRALWPHFVVDAGNYANAAALNHNSIIVYRSLLERVENDDSLALILAHEVAHLVLRHGVEENVLVASNFIPSKNERTHLDFEMEADRLGVILFAAAGYNPRQADELLKDALSHFSFDDTERTHPMTARRVQQVTAVLPVALKVYRESLYSTRASSF